ncbi:MAG: 3-deoxy-manno-octulosonate cytidylyltransferase [Candidatus Aminicenantales bacterium]
MSTVLGVIPARFGSTRFPGKPLAPILGRPMVQWVYEGARASKLLSRVVIATDDGRIAAAARAFGADAVMTSPDCASGTDRAAEVAASSSCDFVINIQGDEPLVRGEMLDGLVRGLEESGAPMATLVARVERLELLNDPHIVKVVADGRGYALYFSRSALPHGCSDYFYQHIGIYGYGRDFLLGYKALSPSRLEKAERLEQLRALENGWRVRLIEIPRPTLSVDTPADIIKVEEFLVRHSHE